MRRKGVFRQCYYHNRKYADSIVWELCFDEILECSEITIKEVKNLIKKK